MDIDISARIPVSMCFIVLVTGVVTKNSLHRATTIAKAIH